MHADAPPAQPLMTASPPARAETPPIKAKQRSKSQKKRERLAAAAVVSPVPSKPKSKQGSKAQTTGPTALQSALAAVIVAAGNALSPCAFLPIAVLWNTIGDIAISNDSMTYGRLGGETDVSGYNYPVKDYCVGG